MVSSFASRDIDSEACSDCFDVLGVERQGATKTALRAAYVELCLRWHPDKNPGSDVIKCKKMFIRVKEAYDAATVQILLDSPAFDRVACDFNGAHIPFIVKPSVPHTASVKGTLFGKWYVTGLSRSGERISNTIVVEKGLRSTVILHANEFDKFELENRSGQYWQAGAKLADGSVVNIELAYDKPNDLLQFRQRQPEFVFYLTGQRCSKRTAIVDSNDADDDPSYLLDQTRRLTGPDLVLDAVLIPKSDSDHDPATENSDHRGRNQAISDRTLSTGIPHIPSDGPARPHFSPFRVDCVVCDALGRLCSEHSGD